MNCNSFKKRKFEYARSPIGSLSLIAILLLLFTLSSCLELVEEGIDVSYLDSDATVKVEPIDFESAAAGETVSYSIEVNSAFDIKSCIIQAAKEGRNGSGFNVSDKNFDDPFADHIFGTVREGIRSFKVRYDYIIPEEINKSRITFTIIDASGKASVERTVEVVPAISSYKNLKLHAKNRTFHDGFASINGKVYTDIKSNYSEFTEENVAIQEEIDIVFFYDEAAKHSTMAAPSSGRVDLDLFVENKTLFKKLNTSEIPSADQISAAMLYNLTNGASILSEGSEQVVNFKVGDVIGFTTDLNAIHSLKSGLIFITGLHPSTVERYKGVSYVVEFELLVQK